MRQYSFWQYVDWKISVLLWRISWNAFWHGMVIIPGILFGMALALFWFAVVR